MKLITNRYQKALLFLLSSVVFLVPSDAWAAMSLSGQWTKVSDGKLELYTGGEVAQAGEVLDAFAHLRSFYKQAAPFPYSDDSRLVIVAFQSGKEFSQYRLNAGSCAFYQQTSKGEYVVLQDLLAQHRDVSLHEFTHFVIAHSGLKLPLWLNEGIADAYSTIVFNGGEAELGRQVPGRMAMLRHYSWLPLNSLFQVGTDSTYYSEPAKMMVFYSESWALAHMLAFSSDYANGFPQFLQAVSAGRSMAESFQSAYGKSVPQVEGDLRNYLDQQHLPTVHASVKFPPTASVQTATATGSDVDVVLSDLSLANPNSRADIQSRLTSAADKNPENARAEEALGFMAMRQGKSQDARLHFHKAIERHSTDPTVYFYAAHYDREADVAGAQIRPLLLKALEWRPDYYEARLELALLATTDHDYVLALDSLAQVRNPKPEHAYTVAYTLAYCYAQVDKGAEARKFAKQAQGLSKNEQERTESARLLAFIDDQAPSTLER